MRRRDCSGGWLVAAIAAWAAVPASAGVRINRVTVDGRDVVVSVKEGAAGEGPATIRIAADAERIDFQFSGGWGLDPPGASEGDQDAPAMARGMRLRHRLEGIDDAWRDAPAKVRVFLQFFDASGSVLDSVETTMAGESPGWQGRPQLSAFCPYRLTARAPPRAVRVTGQFLSHGGVEVVGAIGIDDVAISVTSSRSHEPTRHSFPLKLTTEPARPLDTPEGWARRGGRAAMAQLRIRPQPEPHPILVVLDDDPEQYGNWSLFQGVPVDPGDTVTLSWTAAHSLGLGGSASATYERLRPGRYTFRAGAFRPGGDPTDRETSLAIDVVVPWYRRPETWLIAALLGMGPFVALGRTIALQRVRRRLKELERAHSLERERTRIARDLHDEVGAALTEIAMQHFWVKQEIAEHAPQATLDRVERVRQSAVDLVRNVDAIVWAVNPVNDTLDRFVPYLTHSVEQFLDAAGVPARIDVPDSLPSVAIEGAARHGLFLVVREAVNNAVKHARPSQVRLTVGFEQGWLRMTVEDDGCGVAAEKVSGVSGRSGLGNMQRRIEELGGRFSLEERPGGGARVTMEVPLAGDVSMAVSE